MKHGLRKCYGVCYTICCQRFIITRLPLRIPSDNYSLHIKNDHCGAALYYLPFRTLKRVLFFIMSLIFQESKCELDTFSKGGLKNKTCFGFHISIIPGIALSSTTYYIFKAKSNLVIVDCLDCQFQGDLSEPYQQNYK
jgi:hypothetical protein